jgi:hypothetical protein
LWVELENPFNVLLSSFDQYQTQVGELLAIYFAPRSNKQEFKSLAHIYLGRMLAQRYDSLRKGAPMNVARKDPANGIHIVVANGIVQQLRLDPIE